MDLLLGIAGAILSDSNSPHTPHHVNMNGGGRGRGAGGYHRHSRYGAYGPQSGGHHQPMNQQQIYQQVASIFGPMAFLPAAPVTQQQQVQYSPSAAGGVRPHQPYRPRTPYTQGRVKGLFVGINYKGVQGAELDGCVNDVSMMIRMLEQIDFPIQEAAILVDDRGFPNSSGMPTRANIIQHMQWLVDGARPGDCLFFHFSGHGSQTKDASGDETDGMDETLVPLDYKTAGCIIDDDIYKIMCSRLPAGVRLTAVMDCCHSGTLMDLPFSFEATEANMSNYGTAAMHPVKPNTTPCQAEVIMFSGCADSQTSADVGNVSSFGNATGGYRVGNAGGACTNALTQVLTKTSGLTYMALFKEMRRVLKEKRYSQVPQLSASHPIDLNRPFSLFISQGPSSPLSPAGVPYQHPSPPAGAYQHPTPGGYQPQPQYAYNQHPPQQPYAYNQHPPTSSPQQPYAYNQQPPASSPQQPYAYPNPQPYQPQQPSYYAPYNNGGQQQQQQGYPQQPQGGYPGYPPQSGAYGGL